MAPWTYQRGKRYWRKFRNPPYELQDVFRLATDDGAGVSAIQVGTTRNLTSPADLVRENFLYLR